MELRRVAHAVGGVLIASVLTILLNAQPAPRRTALTQRQVEGLIDLKAPDSTVAAEISERGIGFRLTRATLHSLRDRGAGTRTLGVLSRFLVSRASPFPPGLRHPPPVSKLGDRLIPATLTAGW